MVRQDKQYNAFRRPAMPLTRHGGAIFVRGNMNTGRPKISNAVREEVFASTGGACYYCGALATDLDHFVPRSYIANDTARNLVPACSICNSIASNKHFKTRADKKAYILDQRASEKWQRRLARMEVTLVTVDQRGRPIGVVVPPKEPPKTVRSVWEPPAPVKNPFRQSVLPQTLKPARKESKVIQEGPRAILPASRGKYALPEKTYHKPRLRRVSKGYFIAQTETRRYVKSLVSMGFPLTELQASIFTENNVKALSAAANDKPISERLIIKMFYQMNRAKDRARWALVPHVVPLDHPKRFERRWGRGGRVVASGA